MFIRVRTIKSRILMMISRIVRSFWRLIRKNKIIILIGYLGRVNSKFVPKFLIKLMMKLKNLLKK